MMRRSFSRARRYLFRIIIPVLLAIVSIFPTIGAERVALVMGNSSYEGAALANPVNDAAALTERLKLLQFQVIQKNNGSRAEMNAAIRDLATTVSPGGVALFFFAGHGLQVKGQNFLVPIGAEIVEEFDAPEECVSMDRVLEAMDSSESSLNIVILDCCRNNPYKRSWSRSVEHGLAQTDVPEGTLICFAAAPGKEALDGIGSNSPFTESLIAHLGSIGTSLNDTLMTVRKEVFEKTGERQRPWVSHDFLEPFILNSGEAVVAMPARPQPAPIPPRADLSGITRGNPYVNPLGMKFVPLPGTKTLVSVWETRKRDFRKFIEESGYRYGDGETPFGLVAGKGWDAQEDLSWESPGFPQTEDDPVCAVSWFDAQSFCKWMSQKEGLRYRLPTDHEWSVAVGIGSRESGSASPTAKDADIEGIYPWGASWPPPTGSGNYAGAEVENDPVWQSVSSFKTISGFRDAYERTSPVGSFSPNTLGIFDLGGNVYEWCADFYDPASQTKRVLRGASWRNDPEKILRSSDRTADPPETRYQNGGFRCVLELP